MMQRIFSRLILLATVALAVWPAHPAFAQTKASKPNILLIMCDDVGIANISAYSMGLVGYQTPNIERTAWWSTTSMSGNSSTSSTN